VVDLQVVNPCYAKKTNPSDHTIENLDGLSAAPGERMKTVDELWSATGIIDQNH